MYGHVKTTLMFMLEKGFKKNHLKQVLIQQSKIPCLLLNQKGLKQSVFKAC